MQLLLSYAKRYWTLLVLALVLAAINQTFSLLDPLVFRQIIDNYVARFQELTAQEFFRGVALWLGAAGLVTRRNRFEIACQWASSPVPRGPRSKADNKNRQEAVRDDCPRRRCILAGFVQQHRRSGGDR